MLPQVAPLWTSYALYRFESNARSATVLGLIGAGGIGQTLFDSINSFTFRPDRRDRDRDRGRRDRYRPALPGDPESIALSDAVGGGGRRRSRASRRRRRQKRLFSGSG